MNILFLSLICLSSGLSVLSPLEKIANESYSTTSGADLVSAIMSNTDNPETLVSLMSNVNPTQLNEVIVLIQALLKASEDDLALLNKAGTDTTTAYTDATAAYDAAVLERVRLENDYVAAGDLQDAHVAALLVKQNEASGARTNAQVTLDNESVRLNNEIQTLTQVIQILQGLNPAASDIVFLAKGSFGQIDIGSAETDNDFLNSALQLVRRDCGQSCRADYQTIFYKRTSAIPDGWSIYNNMYSDWFSAQNNIHVDFELYSTLEDACNGVNQWQYCNYNDPGIGFPRDCGINGGVGGQWNSKSRGGHADFQYTIIGSC